MSGTIVINDCFEILTPNGYQNFLGVKRSFKQTITIKFTNGHEFSCTPDHKLIVNKKQITAGSLKPGNLLYGNRVVWSKLTGVSDVYDPIEVSGGNLYYSDNIVSHNCKFLGSSLTLINADVISRMSLAQTVYSKDGLDIYEKPQKGHTYVIVADTAKGVGGDYSAFTIIDITEVPDRMIGKYRNNTISPLLYPNVIYEAGRRYNNAYVLVEVNSSEQVPHILYQELEYENILFVNRSTNSQVVSGGFGGGKTQLGVNTDKRVKRIGCHNFKSLVEENKLIIEDADTISEISTFIETKGSYSADEGYHDDLVMSLVLFSWLTTNPYFKDLNNVNLRDIMYRKQMQAIEDELTPFGVYDDGNHEEKAPLNF